MTVVAQRHQVAHPFALRRGHELAQRPGWMSLDRVHMMHRLRPHHQRWRSPSTPGTLPVPALQHLPPEPTPLRRLIKPPQRPPPRTAPESSAPAPPVLIPASGLSPSPKNPEDFREPSLDFTCSAEVNSACAKILLPQNACDAGLPAGAPATFFVSMGYHLQAKQKAPSGFNSR